RDAKPARRRDTTRWLSSSEETQHSYVFRLQMRATQRCVPVANTRNPLAKTRIDFLDFMASAEWRARTGRRAKGPQIQVRLHATEARRVRNGALLQQQRLSLARLSSSRAQPRDQVSVRGQ